MLKRNSLALFLLIFLLPAISLAQLSDRNSEKTGKFQILPVELSYDQNHNHYKWSSSVGFMTHVTPRSKLVAVDRYDANMIHVAPDDNKWKDQHNFQLQYMNSRWDNYPLKLLFSYRMYKDRQTGLFNDVSVIKTAGEIGWNYRYFIFGESRFVYQNDKRVNQEDSGPGIENSISLPDFRLEEYSGSGGLVFNFQKLGQRSNSNGSVNLNLQRNFTENSVDSLNVSMLHSGRDYYISSDGKIESRKEYGYLLDNSLGYNVSENIAIMIKTNLYRSDVSISNTAGYMKRDRNDLKLGNDTEIIFRKNRIWANLRINQEYEEQEYETQTGEKALGIIPFDSPDNRYTRTSITQSLGVRMFQSDTLLVRMNLIKFKYDTPSKLNYDDRDEQRAGIEFQEIHRFSRFFTLNVTGSADLNHLIYIKKQKSAENHWNRIFRLNPVLYYQPVPSLFFTGKLEILANYIDYDYNALFTRVKSFVHRKLSSQILADWRNSSSFSIHASYQHDNEENGLLRWKEFEQNILVERTIDAVTLTATKVFQYQLSVSPVIHFFRRAEHYPVIAGGAQEERDSVIDNNGAGLYVRYMLNGSSSVTANFTRRTFKRSSNNKEVFQEAHLGLNFLF